jgi:hypothetical protein
MGAASLLVLVAALAAVAYQAYVTALLVRSDALSRLQLRFQLVLVWLAPLIGAVICHWFFRLHGAYEKPRELKYPEGETYDGIEKGDIFSHLP